MARALSQSSLSTLQRDGDPTEWHSLRSELVALLDQVDSQVARSRRGTEDPVTEMRPDIPEPGSEARHRDALKSVQRAITRFEETQMPPNPRDSLQAAIDQIRARQRNEPPAPAAAEPAAAPQPQPAIPAAAPPMPAAPPAASASSQQKPMSPALALRAQDSALIERLAQTMGGISGRLENLETEIKSQLKSGANIKDVADQVAQLAHVVELLAGAVGETGQVKRLETQIASLGQIMSKGREMDVQSLTRRLDDVAATVGKLAELQVHFADKVQQPVETQAFEDGVASIEMNVRAVYDRIDALERAKSLKPEDLEHVTAQMARFTEAMRENIEQPRSLIELVDALNTRISDIESGDRLLHGLRKDLGALRDTIVVAMGVRFEAIETRIDALGNKVSTRDDMAELHRQIGTLHDRIGERPIDPGVGQIETQVRQLVARMDQTTEQLAGLAKLYASEPQQQMPDFNAVADMVAARAADAVQRTTPVTDYDAIAESVATRTADAVQRSVPQPAEMDMEAMAEMVAARTANAVQFKAPVPDLDMDAVADAIALRTFEAVQRHNPQEPLAETVSNLEAKITRMLDGMRRDPEVDDFGGMQAGIAEVNDRLKRLEASILERRAMDAAPAEIAEPIAPAPVAVAPSPTLRPRSDAMPRDPAADAPLNAPPFPPPAGPVAVALEGKSATRKRHPGLDTAPAQTAADVPAGFEPEKIAVPPPPRPSAGFVDVTPEPASAAVPDAPVPASSRNTFIEAARRAAQRQNQPAAAQAEPSSGSLIGRAFARFQPAVPEAVVDVPSEAKPARRTAPMHEMVVAAPVSIEPSVTEDLTGPATEADVKESFLSRNRKVILLAAAIVALGCLTINFAVNRMSADEAAAPAAAVVTQAPAPAATDTPATVAPTRPKAPVTTGDIGGTAQPATAEAASASSISAGPRVIPMADSSLNTGSIDKSAAMGFATSPAQAMPSAFSAATDLAAADPATSTDALTAPATPDVSPVQVELPPDGVGPVELRQAAADGDARAQFEVGAIFSEGRAVPQDYKLAATWYERAAAQGFAPAQYRLGSLYENGQGVEKDLNSARLWYERAAEAGNRMSMHNLAALYAGGQLGKQQFDSAAKWFEEAADRGLTDSQFNLGMLYARGLGVTQSLPDSYKWFGIAALSGDKDSAKARDDIARSLDADTVAKLNTEIATFKPEPIDLSANFAPIGTWSKSFDPGETIATRDIVQSVQKALTKLGYDIGTPDGIAGKKTADAIKNFEKATGMSEVGLINPRLLAVLGSQPV